MKNFFLYLSGCLYTNKECTLAYKKPKRYSIIIFIISLIMLLSPVEFSFLRTSKDSCLKQIPNVENVLLETSIILHDLNNDVRLENGKLEFTNEYEGYVKNYKVVIKKELEVIPEMKDSISYKDNNLVIFLEDSFYARYAFREDGKLTSYQFNGNYSMTKSFSFDGLYENRNDNDAVKNNVGSFLKAVYLSNWQYNTFVWIVIIEMYNLLYLLLGTFLFLLCNTKGRRDYRLSYGQAFLTLMSSIIMPSIISTFVGLINFSFFTLTYIVVSLGRLLVLCINEFSNKNKYDHFEKKEADKELKLNFK